MNKVIATLFFYWFILQVIRITTYNLMVISIKKKILIFLLTLFIILFFSFLLIRLINKNVSPIVLEYSKGEIKRMASIIINKSIDNEIIDKIDLNKLFIVEKSSEEEVITVTLNSQLVNQIINDTSDACGNNLRLVEEKKYDQLKDFDINEKYFYVPIGLVFNNSFANNIGPKIPINLKLVGNVTSGVTTDIKDYGINNSLITISIEIKVEIMVILPLSTDYLSITNYIPLAVKLIQGKVPNYYGGNVVLGQEKNYDR